MARCDIPCSARRLLRDPVMTTMAATQSPWDLEYRRTPDSYVWGIEPSTLAVELADQSGMTLIGFLRGPSMNVYAGGTAWSRIDCSPA